MAKITDNVPEINVKTDLNVKLKRLNTDDFDLTQIQKYIQQSLTDISNNNKSIGRNFCVITQTISKTIAANTTFSLNSKIDDSNIYDIDSGVFTMKSSGYAVFSVNIQSNGLTPGVNYILSLLLNKEKYTLAGATVLSNGTLFLNGSLSFVLESGDKLLIQSNGPINFSDKYTNQLVLKW